MTASPGSSTVAACADPSTHAQSWRRRPGRSLALATLALLFAAVVLRTAWVSDDAYITFRTVDNALHGDGLRWNPAERVQTYTHPLWMLLLLATTAVTGNPYLSSLGLSFALTGCAVVCLLRSASGRTGPSVLALVGITWSSAFVDYSTSGLENALSHALLGVLLVACADPTDGGRSAFRRGMIVALIGTTRLDLLVLAGPLALGTLQRRRRTLPWFTLGLWPLAGVGGVLGDLLRRAVSQYRIRKARDRDPQAGTAAPGLRLPARLDQPGSGHAAGDPRGVRRAALVGGAPIVDPRRRPRAVSSCTSCGLAATSCRAGSSPRPSSSRWCSWCERSGPFQRPFRRHRRWRCSPSGLSAPGPLPRLLLGGFPQPMEMIWPANGIADERRYYFPRTALLTRHRIRTGV